MARYLLWPMATWPSAALARSASTASSTKSRLNPASRIAGSDVRPQVLVHRLDEAPDLSRHEPRPGVVVGQVERDVVGRPALPQEEADALQVPRDIGHDRPPGVPVVEDAGRVEAPSRVRHAVRGVGPAVADQLVDALEEVQVGLRLHVEGRGPERRRVEPRPRFRRDDGPVVQVPDGSGPSRRAQRLPLRSFAFGQIDAGVARDGGGRDAVALDAKPRAAPRRPGLHGREEPLVEKVRQRASPVAADRGGGWPGVQYERRQQRPQVVPAACLERLEEVAGPVGLVHFQAVAEHGVGRRRLEGRQQAVADRRQIVVDGRAIVVVEDEPFGAQRRALHHHAGAAADEEQHLARVRRHARQAGQPAGDVGDLPQPCRRRRGLRRGQERRQQLFAGADVGHRDLLCARWHGRAHDSQLSGGVADADLRPAVRPAAAERQVGAEAELPRLRGGEAHVVEKGVRKKRVRLEAQAGIVEDDGIDRLDLEAADAAVLHEAHLALEAGLRHRRAEPPPPHHDPRVVRRRQELAMKVREAWRRALGRGERQRANQEQHAGREEPCAACGVHDREVV